MRSGVPSLCSRLKKQQCAASAGRGCRAQFVLWHTKMPRLSVGNAIECWLEHGTPSRRWPEASPKKEFKKEGRPMEHPRIPLEDLQAQVAACRRCPFVRWPHADGVRRGQSRGPGLIVGEAPGKNEDLQGEPFVGAAGKYLNELLGHRRAVPRGRLHRQCAEVPSPSNRDPRPEEIRPARTFLREQTRTINPEYMVTTQQPTKVNLKQIGRGGPGQG